MKTIIRLILLAVVLTSASLLTGCATTDSENRAERPWNSPKSWETGLPSSFNQGPGRY